MRRTAALAVLALASTAFAQCDPSPLFPGPVFGAGDEPESVAIGDLDGDGIPDLAVANAFSDDVSVLLNQCGAAGLCPGDCDDDGSVNFSDLVAMLGEFGTGGTNPGCDADGSGTVNFSDLVATLGLFGDCP